MQASVSLDDKDWGAVMAAIAEQPWRIANPLLMKIGDQLRAQHMPAPDQQPAQGNSKGIEEAHHE